PTIGVRAIVVAVRPAIVAIVARPGERAADDRAGREPAQEGTGAPVATMAPVRCLALRRNRDHRNAERRGRRESCQGLGHRRYLARKVVLSLLGETHRAK